MGSCAKRLHGIRISNHSCASISRGNDEMFCSRRLSKGHQRTCNSTKLLHRRFRDQSGYQTEKVFVPEVFDLMVGDIITVQTH